MQRSCSDLGVDPLSLPHKFYIQFCHVTTLTGTWKGKPPNLKSLKPVLHRILDPLKASKYTQPRHAPESKEKHSTCPYPVRHSAVSICIIPHNVSSAGVGISTA